MKGQVIQVLRSLVKLVQNLIEIYIPLLSFIVMFITFLMEVFFRYVLNNPLTWPFEVTTVTFLWTVLFGAILAMRSREHIAFPLFYEKVSKEIQRVLRFLSNGLIFVSCALVLYPSYRYISFMKTQDTPVLNIPFSLVYAPFMVFLIMIMVYTGRDIIADIRRTYHEEVWDEVDQVVKQGVGAE